MSTQSKCGVFPSSVSIYGITNLQVTFLSFTALIEKGKWMLGCPTDTSDSKYPNINLSLSTILSSLASCYPSLVLSISVTLNQKSLSEMSMPLLIILLYHNTYPLVLHLKASIFLPYQVGTGFFSALYVFTSSDLFILL